MRIHAAFLVLTLASISNAQKAFVPTESELRDGYERANEFQKRAENATFNLTLRANWLSDDSHLWYVKPGPDRTKQFILVASATGQKRPAFDHKRLAEAIGKETDPQKLPFDEIAFDRSLATIRFTISGQRWEADLSTYQLKKVDAEPRPERANAPAGQSPDGKRTVRIAAGQIEIKETDWVRITKAGDFSRFSWAPDSRHLVAFRLLPGDRQQVHLLKSSLPRRTRAGLESRLYDQPGDKLDTFETYIIDTEAKSETKLDLEPIMGGGQPWAGPPGVRWWQGKAILEFPIRGYQQHRVISVDPTSKTAKTLVNEEAKSFIDQSKTWLDLPNAGKEFLWSSERDGWCHIYRINEETSATEQITKGPWVVRGIEHYNEFTQQLWFTASGIDAKQDPYHIQNFRINTDGTHLINLTPADGTHTVQFSPNRKFLVDTYSRVDAAPIHELRDTGGKLITTLETGEISQLLTNGVRLPERFVAKGRDGKTDIWGIVVKPSNFDPKRKYPIIENIYAGPHDSFVPKSFRSFYGMHRLAELGFIVVQIDGMGTNNRGKAFHDVCWKNIADAGFPDRILWMQALAKKMPQADITRVGIYGTSAGGQESAAGMLFHPEFYKVAVSSCGCHDNRIDKQWWNEQWMGYPVGDHYDQQSNITNAAKLQGKLMLIVGENDRNVPPESTFRFADALIKANKDFELVVIPGADHTDGGPYGEKKRRDFFVRWLHGVNPPSWNQN